MLVPPHGRSVFSRTVRQGTPKTVDSSCKPPQSVAIAFGHGRHAEELDIPQRRTKFNHCNCPDGSGAPISRALPSCTDAMKTAVTPEKQYLHYLLMPPNTVGSFTFKARCIVTSASFPALRPPSAADRSRQPLASMQDHVDQHISNHLDRSRRPVFVPQFRNPARFANQQQIRNRMSDRTIKLLRHRAIKTIQPRFGMNERHPQLQGGNATSHYRITLANEQ
jgi:hypothetical protein